MPTLLELFPLTAEVRNNHLWVGGCDLVELAREFGTPLYLFDEYTLRTKCREFREEFGRRYPDSLIIYASKAFSHRALVRLFQEEGLGLDVVSGGELAIARAAGFPMDRVYFHGNNKSQEELELALGWGVGRVVVDNFQELGLLEEVAKKGRVVQDILLRLSPGVDPHTHRFLTTGAVDSKFGFPMEAAEPALRQALSLPHLRLRGLHFHIGSAIYEVEPYPQAIALVLDFAREMKRRLGWEPEEFNVGGGFAISYTQEEQAPPLAHFAQAITSSLKRSLSGLTAPRLIVEPGRALVGQAGVALYRVGVRKEIPGVRVYVSVDGGMGDNIRPALYEARYAALVANRATELPQERVTLAGKFCESGDILIRDIDLPPLHLGDLIAVPASGAYSIPMSSNYNAFPRPAILLLSQGRARLIRRRESYENIMARDEG